MNTKVEVLSQKSEVNHEEYEEIEKISKPMWLTNQFVDKNIIMMFVTFGIFALSFLIVILFGLFEMSEQHGREYLIWNDEKVKTMDIWAEMQTDFKDYQDKLVTTPERSQEKDDYNTNIIFECDSCNDNNVLTLENIKKLREIENKILNLPDYPKYCLATSVSTDCSPNALFSITTEFSNPDSITQGDLISFINQLKTDEDLYLKYKILFGKEFTQENPKSTLMRSLFKFGSPIMIDGRLKPEEGQKDKDFEQDQMDKFKDFSEDLQDASQTIEEPSGVKIMEYNMALYELETGDIIMRDFALIMLSVAFVLIYMTFHLRSLFLSSLAMVNIVISFPLTLIVFRTFQITYFSELHILAIFVVLGIAADDVFVFIDAWDQSEHIKQFEGSYNRRMAYTFRRAAKAMLATSSTTAACFFATGLSELMPLASFGIFAGILVPMNFLLVITAFPTFIMFFEYKLKKFKCPCFFCLHKKKPAEGEEESHEKGSKIEIFFEKKWTEYTYKFRIPILIAFAIWVAIAIWRTTKLTPVEEEEEFLPDSLETIYASNLIKEDFHISSVDRSVTLNVFYYFGLKDIDREGISKWDAEDRGKLIYDEDFDLSPPENQQWLYDFCETTKTDKLVLDEQVSCFMPSFKQFVETVKSKTFPVQKEEFFPILKEYTKNPLGLYHFYRQDLGIIDDKLKYVQFWITAKGVPMGGFDILNPQYESWEEFRKRAVETAPNGLKSQKQTALFPWVWMPTERAFVSNAIDGILISIAFSFIVLIITSMNILTSFYALLSIFGVIVSVILVIVANDWQLGVSESLALVIIIGLSVDYVVHLANHYIESIAYSTRYEKIQVSLKEIGVSIVSGAITTIGSGIFLIFANSLLFNKFGILILSTIAFAVLFSLVFFIALLHTAGPTGNAGNLKVIFNRIFAKNCAKTQPEQQQQKQVDIENQGVKPMKKPSSEEKCTPGSVEREVA